MNFLDKHRNTIICGNAFDFLKEAPDNSFDAVITDPPFGIGFKYLGGTEEIRNHKDYGEWLKPLIKEIERVTKWGGFIAVFQSGKYFPHLYKWFTDDYLVYGSCKNFLQVRSNNLFNFGMDPVMVKYKGFGFKEEGWVKEKEDIIPLKPKEIKRNMNFHVGKVAHELLKKWKHERKHPCPRPLDTICELVENFTIENGDVLDCFSGSGTLPVACILKERNYFAVEAVEKYINISNDRIKDIKDKRHKRLNKKTIVIEEEELF